MKTTLLHHHAHPQGNPPIDPARRRRDLESAIRRLRCQQQWARSVLTAHRKAYRMLEGKNCSAGGGAEQGAEVRTDP